MVKTNSWYVMNDDLLKYIKNFLDYYISMATKIKEYVLFSMICCEKWCRIWQEISFLLNAVLSQWYYNCLSNYSDLSAVPGKISTFKEALKETFISLNPVSGPY